MTIIFTAIGGAIIRLRKATPPMPAEPGEAPQAEAIEPPEYATKAEVQATNERIDEVVAMLEFIRELAETNARKIGELLDELRKS